MPNKEANIKFNDFLRPVFKSKKKNVILTAGRRSGKTYDAVNRTLLGAFQKRIKGLWVDTTQANIKRYIEEYFLPQAGQLWETIKYNRQENILDFANGSRVVFGSAERPENLEGFGYDLVMLNEAGLILKKDGLWEKSIKPMTKDAQTFLIGTPKGKTGQKYYELSINAKNYPDDWDLFHFSCYDSPHWKTGQLEQIKAESPAYIWQQEYLAEFVDVYEGSFLNYDDIQYYDHLPDIQEAYIHVDTTHTAKETSDYFCMLCLGKTLENKVYVIDYILTKELDPQAQARAVISFYQANQRFNVKKLTFDAVSNDGFGLWTRDMARQQSIFLPLEAKKYPNDKVSHFTSSAFPLFRSKSIYLPQNNRQNSLAIDQLLAFPTKDVNDDFVDGLSGACDNITQTVIDYEANTYF